MKNQAASPTETGRSKAGPSETGSSETGSSETGPGKPVLKKTPPPHYPRALDARLAPAAATVWATTWLLTGPLHTHATTVTLALAAIAATLWLLNRALPHNALPALALALTAATLTALTTTHHLNQRATDPTRSQQKTASYDVVIKSRPKPLTNQWASPQTLLRATSQAIHTPGHTQRTNQPVTIIGHTTLQAAKPGETWRIRAKTHPTQPGHRSAAILTTNTPAHRIKPAPPWQNTANKLQATLKHTIRNLPPQAKGLIPGIALGDDNALPPTLKENLQITGLTHLTAVSGAHVAIILTMLLAATPYLPTPAQTALAGLVLVGLVILVGPADSVVRAAVMGGVTLAARLLGRPGAALAALSSTCLVLLALDPWISRSIGFALSVAATASIITLAPHIGARLSTRIPAPLAHAIAVSTAAWAVCTPLLALITPNLGTYSVLANLAATPAVAPATILGLLAALTGPAMPTLSLALAQAASWATAWIALVANTFAQAPLASITWPQGAGGAALAAIALAGPPLAWKYFRRPPVRGIPHVYKKYFEPRLKRPGHAGGPRRAGNPHRIQSATGGGRTRFTRVARVLAASKFSAVITAASLLVGAVIVAWPAGGTREGWVAIQCDVGQGSALLMRSGPDSGVLVDTGSEDPATGRGGGIEACLRSAGIRKLDAVVITHLHEDHYGAIGKVLESVEVKRVMLGPGRAPASALNLIHRAAKNHGVVVDTVSGGQRGKLGELQWRAWWPIPGNNDLFDDAERANDASLILTLKGPNLEFMGLGDLEPEGQRGLLRQLRAAPDPPAPHVITVAHHGSGKQYGPLVRALPARIALVSAGRGNRHGHPAPKTVRLYARSSAVVLNTAQCGQIWLLGQGRGNLAQSSRCG